MIRMVVSKNSIAAKNYFTNSLDRGDYYRDGQELAGRWSGLACERLGLSEEVRQKDFFALCENRIPGSEQQLTERTKANRRVGYDINFHAPKSVTLLHLLGGDKQVLEAFQEACRETMTQMEAVMRGRVRLSGASGDRLTQNMVWAEFVHTTARPVDGLPDPHLHAHNFTFNATFDEAERRWKAGEFIDLKRHAPFFEAVFHSQLALKLRGLGYGVRSKGKFWEVEGISDDLVDRFSRRTSEINKLAQRLGVEQDAERKAELGARSRQKKLKDVPFEALHEQWKELAGREGLTEVRRARSSPALLSPGELRDGAERALGFAIESIFERCSAVSERKLVEVALRHGVGTTTLTSVEQAMTENRSLIRREHNRERWVTTAEVLEEETDMLAVAERGREKFMPLRPGHQVSAKSLLNGPQRAAVAHVLTSSDRVIGVIGGAGVGKTTLMAETIMAIESRGSRVFVFAPTAEASRSVLRREGFKEAETVAKLLSDESLQKRMQRQVIWVDEAGLLGSKTMAALLRFAEQNQCRVILSGDYRQHSAVERGDALRILVESGRIAAAQIREVVRQKGDYKNAVEHLSRGDVQAGMKLLDGLGYIKERKQEEAYKEAAAEYLSAARAGMSVLAVSPTHVERFDVSNAIRSALRDARIIGKRERECLKLTNYQWTEAEKKDAARYQVGDVVQFSKSSRGFVAGARTEVVGTDPLGNVWVKGKLSPTLLKLSEASRFDVFKPSTLHLAVGDTIRFTRNGYALGTNQSITGTRKPRALDNGSTYQIAGFIPLSGDILLKNGWVVSKSHGHFEHGYVLTSYASQGKSMDVVIGVQTAKSAGAMSMEQFYVTTSRGKKRCVIYTDDKAALLGRVSTSGRRTSAVEVSQLMHRQERGRTPSQNKQRGMDRD